MINRNLLFIVNPISGTGSKQDLYEVIRKRSKSAGWHYLIFPSVASGDYTFLNEIIVQEKITDVIIAGGDGTVNQVIGALRHHNVQFGVLPLGSGNGLAFTAGISKNIKKALDIVENGNSVDTDGYLINGQFGCMLAGLGFDAQVALDFAKEPKRGLVTYVKKTLSNFIKSKNYPFIIHSGHAQIITNALFISMANSNQFGNNVMIAPRASMHDGLLDVVIMAHKNKLLNLFDALKQVTGFNEVQNLNVLNENASLIYFQTDSLIITNPELAPLHIDGDPAESHKKVQVKILEGSFRLIKPAGSSN